jgi:hypothetical protein
MDLQAAINEYERDGKDLNRSLAGGQPPSSDRVLTELSLAMVMVLNELDDQSKRR